jgi:hypothetical protein
MLQRLFSNDASREAFSRLDYTTLGLGTEGCIRPCLSASNHQLTELHLPLASTRAGCYNAAVVALAASFVSGAQ